MNEHAKNKARHRGAPAPIAATTSAPSEKAPLEVAPPKKSIPVTLMVDPQTGEIAAVAAQLDDAQVDDHGNIRGPTGLLGKYKNVVWTIQDADVVVLIDGEEEEKLPGRLRPGSPFTGTSFFGRRLPGSPLAVVSADFANIRGGVFKYSIVALLDNGRACWVDPKISIRDDLD